MENQNPENAPVSAPTTSDADNLRLQMLTQQMRDNQNLTFAIVGGAVAALAGAIAWAVITAVTMYQIGFMAIGIGFLVGFAVRKLGRGITPVFGVVGAVLSLAGCVVGNLLASCAIYANQENVSIWDVFGVVDFQIAINIMVETFSPMDALFYVIAIYYGYKYSIIKPSVADLEPASQNP